MQNKRPPNAEATEFKAGAKQVEIARQGGIASGEAKRKKKLLRECLDVLLDKEMADKNGNVMTGAEALATKLFQQALKGDLRAFEIVRDTAGQKPVEKVVTAEVDPAVIEELERIVLEDDEDGSN